VDAAACARTTQQDIETLYRAESGRVQRRSCASRRLDLAEGVDARGIRCRSESWTVAGIPDKPRPWLISTARFKAIDAMRRRARFDGAQRDLVAHMESRVNDARRRE